MAVSVSTTSTILHLLGPGDAALYAYSYESRIAPGWPENNASFQVYAYGIARYRIANDLPLLATVKYSKICGGMPRTCRRIGTAASFLVNLNDSEDVLAWYVARQQK